jgi:hypothetical protein
VVETVGQEKKTAGKNFKYFIFEERCYEKFFVEKDFMNFGCLKLVDL